MTERSLEQVAFEKMIAHCINNLFMTREQTCSLIESNVSLYMEAQARQYIEGMMPTGPRARIQVRDLATLRSQPIKLDIKEISKKEDDNSQVGTTKEEKAGKKAKVKRKARRVVE